MTEPHNLPTRRNVVHRYEDHEPGAWGAFITAMHSGEPFECDEEMAYYWLEVLPPVYMARLVKLPNGRELMAWFGFAEGADHVTAFWREGHGENVRYFGCRTNQMNPGF